MGKGTGLYREQRTGLPRCPAQLSWRRIAWQFDLYRWMVRTVLVRTVCPDGPVAVAHSLEWIAGASQLRAFGNNRCCCCSYITKHLLPTVITEIAQVQVLTPVDPCLLPGHAHQRKYTCITPCFDSVKFESQTAQYTLHYFKQQMHFKVPKRDIFQSL